MRCLLPASRPQAMRRPNSRFVSKYNRRPGQRYPGRRLYSKSNKVRYSRTRSQSLLNKSLDLHRWPRAFGPRKFAAAI